MQISLGGKTVNYGNIRLHSYPKTQWEKMCQEHLDVKGGPLKGKLTSVLSFVKDPPYIIAHYIDGKAKVQKN